MICLALLFSLGFSALTAMAASSSGEEDTYTDPDTGAAFSLAGNWTQQDLDESAPSFIQAQFVFREGLSNLFQYGPTDTWKEMTQSERSGHTRSDVDTAFLYANESYQEGIVKGAAQQGFEVSSDNVHLLSYGGKQYIEVTTTGEVFGIPLLVIIDTYCENGYCYIFRFVGVSEEAVADFHSVLDSLQVPAAEVSDNPSDGLKDMGGRVFLFVFELIFAFLPYASPLLVYRNLIRKKTVNKTVALLGTILYELIAYMIVNGVLGWYTRLTANVWIVVIWGCFTYRDLVRSDGSEEPPANAGGAPRPSGKASVPQASAAYAPVPQTPQAPYIPAAPAASPSAPQASAVPVQSAPQTSAAVPAAPVMPVQPAQQTPPAPTPRILFCRNCGFRLLEDSRFCSCCGTPVVSAEKERFQ